MAGWDWETPPAGGPDLTDEVDALDDRVTALEEAGGGSTSLQLRTQFVSGGAIYSFKLRPVISGAVTYAPHSGSTAVTDEDAPLIFSAAGGVFPIRVEYDCDVDLTITIRKRSSGGTWSTAGTQAAALADPVKSFDVTLAAGEAFDLHFAGAGGTMTFLYFRVYY